jgi:predicted transcriptional regulator
MRKVKAFRLDERILDSLDQLAEGSDMTVNNYLERLLFAHCQLKGLIPLKEQPPEAGRGGARANAGRPKKQKGQPDPEASAPGATGGEIDGKGEAGS